MPGGILMVLIGSLVIGQVTRGQALQRLGLIHPQSGGLLSGIGSTIGAVGSGVRVGLGNSVGGI